MKEFKFSKTVIPVIASSYDWLRWLAASLFRENHVNYIRKEERHCGVSILANGPSLKSFDPASCRSTDFCMVNSAPESELFFIVKPRYHVMVDSLYFQKPQEKLREAFRMVSWDIDLFVPFAFRENAKKMFGVNTHIRCIPVHCIGLPDSYAFRNNAYRLFKKGLAMPEVQNVLIASIVCMINAGYHIIDVYGADHTWPNDLSVTDSNVVCLLDSHFYDEGQPPMSKCLRPDGTPFSMAEFLRALANTFAAYHFLQGYAEYLGDVTITNCTRGSLIDAFPRKKL